ncbi:uncharacterized protein isoform X3 [Leptinotarsa decemlineata]|uniref:uncharacterized protein isoform X3 n=1 Tax=Leptinotarsa decemlineata TaxID=7539 RepID=UPI003D30624E
MGTDSKMESSSENMDSSDEEYGSLLFFRKDGAQSLMYQLSQGQTTVGSSPEADVRLKISDDHLEKIHCIINVNESGIATILNKSIKAPVKVNGISVRKHKVLNDKDIIEIVGKKCQYLNDNITKEEVEKNEKDLAKKVLTPSIRRSMAPQLQSKSAKKSPNLKTKTPVQVKRAFLKRNSEGTSITPQKRMDQRSLSEKSKTTSKLVVSKALGANASNTKHRLSLGSNPRKVSRNNVNSRVSARNIQFDKNTITSMITEEEEIPSLSMNQLTTPINKKVESVKLSLRTRSSKKLSTAGDLIDLNSPRKSILKNTPRKSELATEDDTSDLLGKTVSFSNVKVRNLKNDKGILYSDETEYLRLSSSSLTNDDSLVFSSDTESSKKSVSMLSLRKSMEKPSSSRSRLSLQRTSLNSVDKQRKSNHELKTRIFSRRSLHSLKEKSKDVSSNDEPTLDDTNKGNSSEDSFELQLSSPSDHHSMTDETKSTLSSSVKISTPRQRCSTSGTAATNSKVYEENDVSLIVNIDETNELSVGGFSMKENDPMIDFTEEDGSKVDEIHLSPIFQGSRQSSSGRRSSDANILKETKGHGDQSSVGKSLKYNEEDEEDRLLDISEGNATDQSELESSLADEEPPPLSKRRLSDRRRRTLEPCILSRRSGKNRKSLPKEMFSSLRNKDLKMTKSPLKIANSNNESTSPCHKGTSVSNTSTEKIYQATGNNKSVSQLLKKSLLSADDKTPEESRRCSLRNSNNFVVQHIENESRTPLVRGKKSLGNLEELIPDSKNASDLKIRSSLKDRESSGEDLDEILKNETRQQEKGSNNSIQVNPSSSSEKTTSITRNRSSGRGKRSLVGDLNSPVEPEVNSLRKSRKSSISNLTLRNRSSVKGEKSLVDDLQKEELDSKDQSCVKSESELNEDSTLTMRTPEFTNQYARSSRKSSLGTLQKINLQSEGQTFKQSSTLPIEDRTSGSNETSRNSLIESTHQDSTLIMNELMTTSRNRSSVNARKSSISDLHTDSTFVMEDETAEAKNNFSRRSGKSSLAGIHHDKTLPLEEQTFAPKNQSLRKSTKLSMNNLSKNLTLPLGLQQNLIITLDNKTPELTRSSVEIKNSSIRRFSQGTTPLKHGVSLPIRRSSRTPKPSFKYSMRNSSQSPANQSSKSIAGLETNKPSVQSVVSVSDNDESLQEETVEKSTLFTAEKSKRISVRLSPVGHHPRRSVRRSSNVENSYTVSLAHSTLNENFPSFMQYDEFTIEDSGAETLESKRKASFRKYEPEGLTDCDDSDMTHESKTPEMSRRSSRRINKSSAEGIGKSQLSMTLETPEMNRTSLMGSINTKTEVISVSDSLESTPENNTSIVYIDSSLDESRKRSHMKLSKTIHSKIEESDLSTPKSAIKSRRGKSTPYQPVTEDITPVSPLDPTESESGFKTPLTTPGLFENIRKSAIKSRSRMQKSSKSLMEELNKAKSNKKATKRPRESNDNSVRQHKKRKLIINEDDSFEAYDDSFESFQSDEALTDISASFVSQDTPSHLSNLTDKPVITHPRTRSSTGEWITKRQSVRRSLPISVSTAHTITSGSVDEEVFEESLDASSEEVEIILESPKNDIENVSGIRRLTKIPKVQNSPKDDLTDVRGTKTLFSTPKVTKSPRNELVDLRGVKKLLTTPKDMKSPKNDLTNIVGVKKLLATPKEIKSPKNDLTNIVGVKKILATPKEIKSPKNDLTNIVGVKKLLATPREVRPPKNDLTNIVGVKKLLATPKEMKSPENDLTNVPNLRKIMSPKLQNSPKNDLSDLRGVKVLLSTPKESKDPQNELSCLEGVADIFNISGVHRLSNTSDIENNEDLFDKLMDKRPPRTYRGKSLSPNKTIDSYGARRKTMGDKSVTSPRVEDWVKDQAVIRLERWDNTESDDKIPEAELKDVVEEPPTRSKKKTRVEEIREATDVDSPPRRGGRRKAASRTQNKAETSAPTVSPPKKTTRGRSKKVMEQDQHDETEEVKEVEKSTDSDMEVIGTDSPRTTRGRKKTVVHKEKSTKGKKKTVNLKLENREIEEVDKPGRVNENDETSEEPVIASVESPKTTTRGRRKVVKSPVVERTTRGKRKVNDKKSEELDVETNKSKSASGKEKVNMDEQKSDNVTVLSDESLITSRSRRNIPEVAVIEKVTRGKKKLVEMSDDILEKSEESTVTLESPKVPTRGRRNAKIIDKESIKKPTRGKRKVEAIESETSQNSKKILKSKDEKVDEISSEQSEVSSTRFKKPYPKATKVSAIEEEEISSNLVDSTTGDISPVSSEELEKENVSKPLRGRKTKKNSENEKLDDKPVLKRAKRGRKVCSDDRLNTLEAREDTKEAEDEKVVKSKTRKAVQKKNSVEVLKETGEEINNSKPTRGTKNKNNEELPSTTTKKQTRGKKQGEDEVIEPVKPTRSRRRKEIEEYTEEEPAKKTTRKNNTEEEDASVDATKRSGRLAKNKSVSKLAAEQETSSPKTRATKGNFNKYGAQFEVESPGKAVGKRNRVVRFE